jgi:hypothetical protein
METTENKGGRPEGDYTIQLELGWEYLTKYKDLKEVIPATSQNIARGRQGCKASE